MGIIDRIRRRPGGRIDAQGPAEAFREAPGPRVEGTAAEPPTGEVAVVRPDWYSILGLNSDNANPDAAVQKFGLPAFRENEAKDGHLRNCLRIRRAALLKKPYQVVPASDSAADKDVAAFVAWVIDNLAGTFRQDLKELMDAMSDGYAVSEKIWDRLAGGPYAGRWAIQELRSKPPENFIFKRDKFGRLLPDGFVVRVEGESTETPVPIDKFVVWTFDKQHENPYGRGLGSTVAWCAWFKKNGVKFWLVFLEKFGSPTIKIQLPRDPSPADKARANEIIKSIQQSTGFWYPEGFDIALLEAASRGTGGFKDLLDWCDRQISKAVLGATLTTDTGEDGGGSYALGKEHTDRLDDLVEQDALELADVVGEQFIKQLVDFNFQANGSYPRFAFTFPKRTAELNADGVKTLAQAGLPIGQPWAYEHFGIEPPAEGDKVLTAPAEPPGPGGMFAEGADGLLQQGPSSGSTTGLDEGRTTFDIVDFTHQVTAGLEGLLVQASAEGGPLVLKAVEDYLDAIAGSGIFENRDLTALEALRPDFEPLRDLLFRVLYFGSLSGITDAQRLLRAKGWTPNAVVLRDDDLAVLMFEGGFPLVDIIAFATLDSPDLVPTPDEAAKWFKRLQVVPRDVYYEQQLAGQAFTIAWTESDQARTTAKKYVLEALNNGWTVGQFRTNLLSDPKFIGDYIAPANRLGPHLETVFRTNLMTAYNQGRRDFYQDAQVAKYIRYWQYNAIMDDRVRPAHAAVHGTTLPPDHSFWTTWFPPNGFNCRCYVDPVTRWGNDRNVRQHNPTAGATDLLVNGKRVPLAPDKGFGQLKEAVKATRGPRVPKPVAPVLPEGVKAAGKTTWGRGNYGVPKEPFLTRLDTAKTSPEIRRVLAEYIGADFDFVDLKGFPEADLKVLGRQFIDYLDEYGDVRLELGLGTEGRAGYGGCCGAGWRHYSPMHTLRSAYGKRLSFSGPLDNLDHVSCRIKINPADYAGQAKRHNWGLRHNGHNSADGGVGTVYHELNHGVQDVRWYDFTPPKFDAAKGYRVGGRMVQNSRGRLANELYSRYVPNGCTAPKSRYGYAFTYRNADDFRGANRWVRCHTSQYGKYYQPTHPDHWGEGEFFAEIGAALRDPGGAVVRYGTLVYERTPAETLKRIAPRYFPGRTFDSIKGKDWVEAIGRDYWENEIRPVYYGLMRRVDTLSGKEAERGLLNFTFGRTPRGWWKDEPFYKLMRKDGEWLEAYKVRKTVTAQVPGIAPQDVVPDGAFEYGLGPGYWTGWE